MVSARPASSVPALPHPSGAFARDARTLEPIVGDELVEDLRYVGIDPGDTVLVHSSMRSIGFVVGGAQTVVESLLAAVGERGTVVVPTHSGLWSEPSHWSVPMPGEWWHKIRTGTPAFHPRITPTLEMGAVVECVRRWPGFRRSWHPRVSFGAVGPAAEAVLADHALAAPFGERSPIGRLYDRSTSTADPAPVKILLIGVGHHASSALHLAESRAVWPGKRWIDQGASITGADGRTEWARWREIDYDADDFELIGAAIGAAGIERLGVVGNATTRLMPLAGAVDVATDWIAHHRVWDVKPVPRPLAELYR